MENNKQGLNNNDKLKLSPFNYPQNYFENLPSEISHKISSQKKHPLLPAFIKTAFAAGFSILIITTFIFIKTENNNVRKNQKQASLNSNDVYEVLLNDENMLDFKESEIEEAVLNSYSISTSENKIGQQSKQENIQSESQLKSEDYYKYLIEEETDIEEL